MGEGMETPRQFVWSASPKSLSPFVIDDSGIWKTGTVSFKDSPTIPSDLPPSAQFVTDYFHSKPYTSSISKKSKGRSTSRKSVRSPQSYYDIDEDSDDDFEFCLFGRNRVTVAMRARHKSSRFLNDTPMPDDLREGGYKGEAEWGAALKVERQRLEHMYYASMVKLNMRLGILSKVIECISVVIMGVKWSINNWLSLGIQLFFNTASASSILYRFNGRFSLPESTVLPELRDALKQRERNCVFVQSLCKLFSAASVITFSVMAIASPKESFDVQNFVRSTYLTAGFSGGGFISHVSLTAWVTCMAKKGRERVKSLGAENTCDWLTSLFSLETAVLAIYLIYHENDPSQTREALRVANYVQLVLASVTGLLGLRDIYTALFRVSVGGAPLPAATDTAPSSPFKEER